MRWSIDSASGDDCTMHGGSDGFQLGCPLGRADKTSCQRCTEDGNATLLKSCEITDKSR